MPAGSYADLRGSCFQEINTQKQECRALAEVTIPGESMDSKLQLQPFGLKTTQYSAIRVKLTYT